MLLFSLGPGLAIRVICAEEPYICKDFPETNNILKIVADFSASVKKVVIYIILIYYRSSTDTANQDKELNGFLLYFSIHNEIIRVSLFENLE